MIRAVQSGENVILGPQSIRRLARDDRTPWPAVTGPRADTWRHAASVVWVRNDSGADRDRFDVLGVAGPVITPTANPAAFQERVAIDGVTPTATHAGRFVILLEPVRAGAFGPGCLDGVCVARVQMNAESHVFAEAQPGQTAQLASGAAGSACLLWIQPPAERDPDPTVAWVVAKIGLPTGAASLAAAFAVITSKAGSWPPYRYAAVQATMDENGGWTQVPDGAAYNNVFNLEEQGAGGQWVNPLVAGDAVLIYAGPDPAVDAFVCSRAHYRGTY